MKRRYIFLLTLVLLLVIGIVLFIVMQGMVNRQQPEESAVPQFSPSPVPVQLSPEETAKKFYFWYLSYPGSPLSTGAFKTSVYLTDNFKNKVVKILNSVQTGANDPILCGQNTTDSFSVGDIYINADMAQMTVRKNYSDGPHTHRVFMIRQGGKWMIDDVRCSG